MKITRVCLALGFAACVKAIRTSQLDEETIHRDLSGSQAYAPNINSAGVQACGEKLRPVITKSDYRAIFSPVVDDRYTFRNKRSGLHLAANEIGTVTTWDTRKDKMSGWKVKKVKGVKGMPRYTLQNTESGRYLRENQGNAITMADCSDAPEACQWAIHLYPEDGHFWTLRNTLTNHWLHNPVQESAVGGALPVVLDDDKTSNASAWLMEAAKLPLFPRRRNTAVTEQIVLVKEMPLWSGTNTTFGDLCGGQRELPCSVFDTYYNKERDFHISRKKIYEDPYTRVVTENQMRSGFCDMSPKLMGTRFRSTAFINAVAQDELADTAECRDMDTWGLVASLEAASISECFSDCLTTLEAYSQTVDCGDIGQDDFDKILNTEDTSGQCGRMPWISLEQLMGWVMMGKCLDLRAPSPLWVTNDKGEYQFDNPCAVADGSTRRSDMYRNGTCPEGTKCFCPRTWIASRQTAFSIRQNGGNLFVIDGSSGVASFLSQQSQALLTRVAIGFVLSPATPLITLGWSALTNPMSWLTPIRGIPSLITTIRTWSCQKTLACWPETPSRLRETSGGARSACRYPPSLKEASGSQVWFMPPPLLKLSKSLLACRVDPCTTAEMRSQKVGFGNEKDGDDNNANVFNCQPLAFEEMDSEQRKDYLTMLDVSGITTEYGDEMAFLAEEYGVTLSG